MPHAARAGPSTPLKSAPETGLRRLVEFTGLLAPITDEPLRRSLARGGIVVSVIMATHSWFNGFRPLFAPLVGHLFFQSLTLSFAPPALSAFLQCFFLLCLLMFRHAVTGCVTPATIFTLAIPVYAGSIQSIRACVSWGAIVITAHVLLLLMPGFCVADPVFAVSEKDTQRTTLIHMCLAVAFTVFMEVRVQMSLSRANEAQRRWLMSLSHDIRSPLHGLMAMVDSLDEDRVPTEMVEPLQTMRSCAHVLAQILKNVLDWGQLDRGATTLSSNAREQNWSVRRIGTDLEGTLRSMATAKRLHVSLVIEDDMSPVVLVAAPPLLQGASNMISNAVKFSPQGGNVVVSVSVRVPEGDRSGGLRLLVAVEDEGPGVSEETRATIFHPFERGTMFGSNVEGVGLGLAIVSHLTSAMGGTCGVSGRADGGRGSRFWMNVPVGAPLSGDKLPSPVAHGLLPPLEGCTLIVDDSRLNLTVLKRLLHRCGVARVVSTDSGKEALSVFRKCASGEHEPCAIAFIDIMMPEMDGWTVIREVTRIYEAAGAPLPILVTATAVHSDTLDEQCVEAGAVLLQKPFQEDDIRQLLSRHFAVPESPVDANPP
jgi:signal transduction histidine kinase/CheY-like chemotaxis protein